MTQLVSNLGIRLEVSIECSGSLITHQSPVLILHRIVSDAYFWIIYPYQSSCIKVNVVDTWTRSELWWRFELDF